jgi:hypothetical protein
MLFQRFVIYIIFLLLQSYREDYEVVPRVCVGMMIIVCLERILKKLFFSFSSGVS